ncbi:MAG: NUDIX hydrolase [Eubacteriales bacterium]|jgi:8-oxo-dGTP pyrophosphatase MutT (NUDIX family)
MSEMVDIYDEALRPAGQLDREEAHRTGALHQVVHCWMIGRREDQPVLYMQQRAADKETFPLQYDIAVGGHLRAGETPLEGLARETWEELGISLDPERLRYVGAVRQRVPVAGTQDRELAQVYLYDAGPGGFTPGEEVARVVWVNLHDYRELAQGLREQVEVTEDRSPRWEDTEKEMWRDHSREFLEMVLPQLEEMEETL